MSQQRKIYYKGVRVGSFGLPFLNPNDEARDKKHLQNKTHYHASFVSSFKEDSPKNLIVMYDIPHEKKRERDWFRRHLKKFDYVMIQKSVWVGPSPLPISFIEYVKSIGLKERLKVFKLAKPYTGKDSDSYL